MALQDVNRGQNGVIVVASKPKRNPRRRRGGNAQCGNLGDDVVVNPTVFFFLRCHVRLLFASVAHVAHAVTSIAARALLAAGGL
jgi:hypothetical protein